MRCSVTSNTYMKKLSTIILGICCAGLLSTKAIADDEKKPESTEKTTKTERKRPALTDEQKKTRDEITAKYDTNKDGKLDAEERKKISDEDKEKLRKIRGGGKAGARKKSDSK